MKRVLPLVLALSCVAGPLAAQTPLPADPLDARDAKRLDRMEQVLRELRSIVFQGRDTNRPVVVQPAETDIQLDDLRRRVEDLEQALGRVNGQLETTAHDLDVARRDAEITKAENKALTDRLAGLEQRAAEVAAAPPAAAPAETDSQAFARGRQLMQDGDYDGAELAFAGLLERSPDSPKAPEAHYWHGKTLATRGAHAAAAGAYIEAIRGWPATGWAGDAVVELSRELIALKKPADACRTLDEFTTRYPKASTTVKARAAAARTQAKCAA